MHKKIISLGFIIAIGLGAIVSQMNPESYSGGSERAIAEALGGRLFLFVAVTISLYVIVYFFKIAIKPFFRHIGRDFQGRKNFFEKIFYSKLLGPSLDIKKKDSITKNTKGRLLVFLYPIVYIVIFLLCMMIAGAESDDEVMIVTFILLLLGIIPYKFSIPAFSSTYNYIKGEK